MGRMPCDGIDRGGVMSWNNIRNVAELAVKGGDRPGRILHVSFQAA